MDYNWNWSVFWDFAPGETSSYLHWLVTGTSWTLATTLVFALPIFLVPLTWARLMRWRIPQDVDLAVYFGRCLGAFILIVEALMLRAALGPANATLGLVP